MQGNKMIFQLPVIMRLDLFKYEPFIYNLIMWNKKINK